MKNFVKIFVVMFLLFGMSNTSHATDPFNDATEVIVYVGLTENQPVVYSAPSTQATGRIAEITFEP